MSRIEKISKAIASIISKNLSIDSDHEEVIAYGAFALFQTTLSILAVAIFGVVFKVLIEVLIISFSAASLRKFSGGVHANTPLSCALLGMLIFGVLALLVKNIFIYFEFKYIILLVILAYVYVFYIMAKYSPVGSVNKPLKKEATRNRLKRQSVKCVTYLLFISIVLIALYMKTENIYLISIVVCITTGIVWQSITLVSLGHLIIENLDKALGGTKIIKRRTSE